MKQYDSMFIQRNETGEIYHLCYTDNSREAISYEQFHRLLPAFTYDPEDGVYWFDGGKASILELTQTPQDSPETNGGKRVVHAQHLDGTTETDAQWWARQGELDDYRQSVDGSSYRGQ